MPGDDTEKVTELSGQVTELEAQVESLTKLLEEAGGGKIDVAKLAELETSQTTLTKQVTDLTAALEKANADKAKAEKLAKAEADLSDDEREYCKAFPPKEKEEFLEMDPEERKKKVKTEKAADETVVIEGQTISKRAVGEATFNVMKAQADRIKKSEDEIAKQRDEAETARLEKRADDDFAHVPGSTQERAAMLKAMAKLDEPVRKSFEAVFTAHEKLVKGGFEKIGHGGRTEPVDGSIEKKAQDFEAKVEKVRADFPKLSKSDALKKARKENPELFKAYQEHGEAVGEANRPNHGSH